jgi:high-affinity Fe2+/Pb2+ permease
VNRTRGRLAFGLGAAAVGWAVLLVAAAFLVPAYSGERCGSGGCTSSSSTLFAENGWWVVELLGGVVLVAALAFYALHVLCSKGSELAGGLALGCIVILAAFAFIGAPSIGLFVIPVVLLLVASMGYTPRSPAE